MEQKEEFYVIYSGSEKLDLTDKPKPVGILLYEGYANSLIQTRWPGLGYVKKVDKKNLLKIIEEEF